MKRVDLILHRLYHSALKLYSRSRRLPPIRRGIEVLISGATYVLLRRQRVQFPQRTTGGWWWTDRYRFEFLMGWLELPSVRQLQQVIKEGMLAVDVGAHIGYYTLLLSRLVGPKGRVYAIEANPENYKLLVANVKASRLTNVVPVHAALLDKSEEVELFLTAGHSTHSLHQPPGTVEKCHVPGTTLDAYLSSQGDPDIDFIKIDIEGAEPLAFAGMRQTIARARNIAVLTELNPQALRSGGVTPVEFVQQLQDMSFRVQTLADDGSPPVAVTPESPLLQEGNLLNLFCHKDTFGRVDRATITRMFRNRPQLRLLAQLLQESGHNPLRVAIYGVADGAEAVSLLIILDPVRTGLDIEIAGFDIAHEYLTHGQKFLYTAQHFSRPGEAAAYAPYLEPAGDSWQLAARWQPHIKLAYGNVLEPGSQDLQGACDLVMCQNTLISFPGEVLSTAVENLAALVRPGGILAVGGGHLSVIPNLIIAQGFAPILEDVEAIHENWLVQRQFYNNPHRPYWALEPFDAAHPDGPIRYTTLFRKLVPDTDEQGTPP